MILKKVRVLSIRIKLVLFLLFLILMMGAVCLVVYKNLSDTTKRYNELLHNVVVLNDVLNNVNVTQNDLEERLTLKSAESINGFNNNYAKLQVSINSFSLDFLTKDEYIIFKDISGMMVSFGNEVDKAIWASRGRDAGEALFHFNESKKISGYMREDINFLVISYINRSEAIYYSLLRDAQRAQTMIIIFISIAVIVSIIFAIIFSRSLTKPILNLTQSAKMISKGEFNIQNIEVTENDEIGILALAFNRMTNNIKQYIWEIKEKSEVENKLQLREMENMKMNSLLREAEYRSLQSQINPHFLFNTLNCIAQTAKFESAFNTNSLLENVSDMLRYNLRKIDNAVTLEDEVLNLKRYVLIQTARYRNRAKFELTIQNEQLLMLEIPCLTLQPFVENAFIHGIENCERPGKITVAIFKEDETVCIEITDTGEGLPQEKIDAFLSKDNSEVIAIKGHTTGIGIRNVIDRLRIFYNRNDVIFIESVMGKGTKVKLLLPFRGGSNSV